MEDIKSRLFNIGKIINGYSPMEHDGLDNEIVFLLLRRTLEQLAFSSLIANKDIYSKVHSDFSKTWQVKKLIKRIEKIHPDFYPKPIAFSSIHTGSIKQFLDIKDGFLTLNELIFLYNKCSEALHTRNPYYKGPRVLNIKRSVSEWMHRIMQLLDLHWISLAGSKNIWLVQMNSPSDGKVHAFLSEPQGVVIT